MNEPNFDPLVGKAPKEVSLSRAPLVRVLGQVTFDPILILRTEDAIAPFQDMIRSIYPQFSKEELWLSPPFMGDENKRKEVIWRFFSSDSEWRVSASTTFIALETVRYVSRADFLARMRIVIDALKTAVGPLHVTRVGVRYVDQITPPELDNIDEMVRPEVLGIAHSGIQAGIQHVVTETFCNTTEGGVIARWGRLPPLGTHDPNIIVPVDQPSWFLDIDAFSAPSAIPSEMDADAICRSAEELTNRSYALFRWAVNDKFLDTYGRAG